MRLALVVLLSSAAALGQTCKDISLGANGNLNGYVPYAVNEAWTTPVTGLPVDSDSTTSFMSWYGNANLHADFGTVYGIPYNVVDTSTASTPKVPITMKVYPGDSDQMVWPLDSSMVMEDSPGECVSGSSDAHALVIDRNTCFVYETWQTEHCSGVWSAANGNVWDLKGGEQRPYGMTSADAAGLSLFGGLIRYEEASAGVIKHAIRFTVSQTKNNANGGIFVAPATHAAGASWSSPALMGQRLRLKASLDITGYSKINQAILTAMKTYGLILADNGGSGYFQGTMDSRWDDGDLHNLYNLHLSDFEVVSTGATAYDATTAPTGAAPTIYTFAPAQATVSAGTPVQLIYSGVNSSYDYIDAIGPVRGGAVTVTPTKTTTYTLTSTNHFGRVTRQTTVTVGAGGTPPVTTPPPPVTTPPPPVTTPPPPVTTPPIVTPPVVIPPVVTPPVVTPPAEPVGPAQPVNPVTITIPGSTLKIIVKMVVTTVTLPATSSSAAVKSTPKKATASSATKVAAAKPTEVAKLTAAEPR